MFTSYAECEIEFLPHSGDAYPLSVTAPGGDATGTLSLPAGDPRYRELLARLEARDTDDAALAELGELLFGALFQGEVREVWLRSQQALQPDQGLRIKLRMSPADPVAALPWELIRDPEYGPLALLDAPIVRYLPQPSPAPARDDELPLRVLLGGGSIRPGDAVERELEEVRAALAELGDYLHVTVEPKLSAALLQRLLREQFHVMHFVGPADGGMEGRPARLGLAGARPRPEWVTAAQLVALLDRSGLRLVALSPTGPRPSLEPLRAIGAALVQAQALTVVTAQFGARDAARAFAGELYRMMAEGYPVDACVTEGRRAVMGAVGLGQADWALPQVYTCAPDGRLLDLPVVVSHNVSGSIAVLPGPGQTGAQAAVNLPHGTLLYAPRPVYVERATPPPRPPRPDRDFRDRESVLYRLQHEIEPGRSAWLRGAPGCGLSALLRQAASTPTARLLPDGVVYVEGVLETATAEDVRQRLFQRFYASAPPAALTPRLAESYLGQLNALFVLDRLPLGGDSLVAIAGTLAGGTVLIGADEPAPDALIDITLHGLPRADAVALLADEAGMAEASPERRARLDRLSAALGDLPLPLLVLGRLIRSGVTSLGTIEALVEALPSRDQGLGAADAERAAEELPLLLAVRIAIMSLAPHETEAVAALARLGGVDGDLTAIATIARLSESDTRAALAWPAELRLVNTGDDRFAIASASLRRALDRLLPPGDQPARAGAYFAAAAAARPGDIPWIEQEASALVAALRVSLQTGDPAQAGVLARAVQPLLTLRGEWGSWERVLDMAEDAASSDAALRAWTLHERGTRAGLLGDREAARSYLEAARRLRENLSDQAGAAATRHNLAYLRLLPPARWAQPLAAEAAAPGRSPAWLWWSAGLLLLAVVVALLLFRGLDAAPAEPTALPVAVAGATPQPSPSPMPTAPPRPTTPALPTATPPSSATTAPTATQTPLCRVTAAALNLRRGPGPAYGPPILALASGAEVLPLARTAGGEWLNVQVVASGQTGWVSADPALLSCNFPPAQLPPGRVPPLPPPQPTATPEPPTPAPPTATPVETPAPAPSVEPTAASA